MDNGLLYSRLYQSFGFEPTQGQQRVLRHLTAFLLSKKPLPLYLLRGYAGTGKTSLVNAIVKVAPVLNMRVILMAPTGRAAKVLSQYTGMQAYTIHRRIYLHSYTPDGLYKSVLVQNKLKNTLFVIDEASMIAGFSTHSDGIKGRNLLDDLMYFVAQGDGCRLLLIGDQAQLPPVGMELSPALDVNYLKTSYQVTAATYELYEVMRQALDSGILFNATTIRTQLQQGKTNLPLFQIQQFSDIETTDPVQLEEQLYDAFAARNFGDAVIICRSNKTANRYNQAIRQHILGMDSEIASGDLIMAVKNNYYWLEETEQAGFIANGDIFEIKRINKIENIYGFHFAHVSMSFTETDDQADFDTIIILESLATETAALGRKETNRLFVAIEEEYAHITPRSKRISKIRSNPYYNALQVKFAYAMTCHKTQGGQWPVVFLDAGIYQTENIDISYLRWLYTAVTRATKKLYLLNFKDEFFPQ